MTNLGSILKSRDITLSTKVRLVVRRVYPRFCLHLNKNLKRRTLEPSACHSSQTDHVIALRSRTDRVITLRSVLQLRVIAQFYLENSRKIHPGMRACQPKDAKRRQSPDPLALLFMFFPPPGPALCKLGQPGVLFVPPEVFPPVLGPSFVLFSRAFPFLVF